jgi:OmpA-OmpF porin, OOP family
MQKLLLILLTILWFALGSWWFAKSDCSSCNTAASAAAATAVTSTAPVKETNWSFADSGWKYSVPANLRFGNAASVPVTSELVNTALDTVVYHAKSFNPGRKIIVTGYYRTTENNTSSFENLGIARAEAVKSLLVNRGYDAALISTVGIPDDANRYTLTPDTLYGGAEIGFAANLPEPVVPAVVNDSLSYTVYFATGQAGKEVEEGLRRFLAKANAYMQAHPGKQLMVTGHTDNKGDAEKNKTLSAGRADYVKSLLVKNGVPANTVATEGKGQDAPIADNATETGRAKNRRVEVTVQ